MALGDPYATPAELEARTGVPDDGTYTALLEIASREVEAFTRRQFNKTEQAFSRRFRALDPERLPVADFYSTDGLAVVIDGALWEDDEYEPGYEPRPFDGFVNDQPGWPYSDLMALTRCWPIRRRESIEVTALWGWAEVPAGIIEATLRMAVALRDSRTGESSVIKSEMIAGYSVTYGIPDMGSGSVLGNVPPEMIPALQYRRKKFGVA